MTEHFTVTPELSWRQGAATRPRKLVVQSKDYGDDVETCRAVASKLLEATKKARRDTQKMEVDSDVASA